MATDFLEAEVLDHLYGNAAYAPPATWYVGLSTTTPTDTGGFTEPVGNGYARVAVTNNLTNFPAAVAGAKSNGTQVTFPTASGAWGTITYAALFDASVAGNRVQDILLTAPISPISGDTPRFPIGNLNLSAD